MKDVDIHPVPAPLEGVFVKGVFTSTLQATLDFKLGLNRPKDQDDIEALKVLVRREEKKKK